MIKDLKDLEKFFKLCRKQGISEISIEGVSVKFGDLPYKPSSSSEDTEIETEGLTPEELMFYSVQEAGQT